MRIDTRITVKAARMVASPNPQEAHQWAAEALDAIRQATGRGAPLWTVLAVARARGMANRIDAAQLRAIKRHESPRPACTLTGQLVHSLLPYREGEHGNRPLPMPQSESSAWMP